MVAGLSYEQILAKFPTFTDGDSYPAESYKGQYLREIRKTTPGARLLWFQTKDTFDHCVFIEGDRTEIRLIKG